MIQLEKLTIDYYFMAESPSLQQTLTQASQGLVFPSESEYPFTYFEWADHRRKRLPARTVLKLLNKPTDTPVKKVKLDNLFKNVTEMQDWFGEEEKATANKFIALKETLTKSLMNIQVFKVGEIEIDVYIAGQTPEGRWVGLSTKVVET